MSLFAFRFGFPSGVLVFTKVYVGILLGVVSTFIQAFAAVVCLSPRFPSGVLVFMKVYICQSLSGRSAFIQAFTGVVAPRLCAWSFASSFLFSAVYMF